MPPNELAVYLISVLLFKYSLKLKKLKMEQNVMFLQNLPTTDWGTQDIKIWASEAYSVKMLLNIKFNK